MAEVIAIRADGNSEIGFGHLMRMKALAHQLAQQGANVIFLSRNPENLAGYQVIKLEKQLGQEEDSRVEQVLAEIRADILIIDSYDYDKERLERAGGLDVLSVYIDDLNRHPFDIDYVVNGNLYAPELNYQGRANTLLGARYLLMREEFSTLNKRAAAPLVRNVLVSFGAADMENVTPGFLRALQGYGEFENLHWQVVVGPVFRHTAEIEDVARGYANITLHYDPDIKRLMDLCDIAVSAAGSTTYELIVSGLPAILVIAAENQVMLAAEAARQGMAFNAGWFNSLDNRSIYSYLDRLINDGELRGKMTACGQELIDGRGAKRVAGILLDEIRGEMSLGFK